MQIKILLQRREFWAVLFGCFLSVLFFLYLFQKNFNSPAVRQGDVVSSAFDQENNDVESPLPTRLKIPKIGVDATIDPMSTTPSGAMEVPSGPRSVGWFSGGPHPGDTGSAVIDGHYGRWKNGDRSVFDNLDKLEKGDVVSVENEKGETITFIVREFRTYDPNADTSDIFSSDDEQSHLNLITCEGVWDKISKSYSKRLVIFTDKQ